jgi:hypothetical protein
MIESGMSLSHMKTDVTIVSHGRVSLDSVPHDCQRCASGKGTVLEGRGHGAGVGVTVFGAFGLRAVAERSYNALRGSVLVVANSRNNSVYKLRSSARRHTHAPQPALNLRSRPGYRPYVASTDTVLAT